MCVYDPQDVLTWVEGPMKSEPHFEVRIHTRVPTVAHFGQQPAMNRKPEQLRTRQSQLQAFH